MTVPARSEPRVMPILRAALARGALIKAGNKYRFGRRHFSPVTVALLIASGEATRRADGAVVGAKPAPPLHHVLTAEG